MKIQRFLGSVALLSGLFTFASCDKEVSDVVSGDKVTVRFILSGDSYADEMRSWGALESETVILPVSDNLYISATLEESPAAPVRGDVNLGNGNKVWIGAYTGTPAIGDSPVASATYTINSSGAITGTGLQVTPGITYTFVAYSYKTTATLPGAGPTIPSIDPSLAATTNLMWCSTTADISAAKPAVTLLLQHKFPTVAVKIISTGYTGSPTVSVSNVTFSPDSLANMDVATGTLTATAGTVNSSTFGTFSPTSGTTITSPALTVNPGNHSRVAINIGSITLGNSIGTFANLTPRFTMNLNPTKAYTFTVNLKQDSVKFAASNIYWDGTKLTFDPYVPGVTPPATSMQKQGVVFKWGSLIGISAPGIAGTASYNWSDTATVYVPAGATNPTWTKMAASAAGSGSKWAGTGWNAIPYARGNDNGTYNRVNDYLTSVVGVGGTRDSTASYKGDICKYIDSNYRMPMSYEFGAAADYGSTASIPAYGTASNHIASDISGQTLIPQTPNVRGITFTPSSGHVSWLFPASGYRFTDGMMSTVGTTGNYWSSSASSAANGSYLNFYYNGLNPSNGNPRTYGFSVRCVLK